MSDGVPAWLAVSGVIVGVAVGSFDIVERVTAAFQEHPPEISQHYFVLETQPEDLDDIATASLENLLQLGPGSLARPESIKPLLDEVLSSSAAERACENLESPVFDEIGCDGLNSEVIFFSVKNNGPSAITEMAIEFETFEFEDAENAALLTITPARLIVEGDEDRCLRDAFDDPPSSGCWARSTEKFVVTFDQPLLPDEYFHTPIHSYLYARYGTEWITSGATTGHLPTRITIGDDFIIEARDRADTLVLRYEHLSAGG